MKKSFWTLCLVAVTALAMQSCKSSQSMVQANADLEGEWNIIELEGESVVPADHQPFPNIGFDIETQRFYGSSGCNRMMGSYTLGGKKGSLKFGQAAGTMMMCPDMTLEEKVHDMLKQVKSYKVIGTQIALYGKMSKPIAVLDRKDLKSEAVLLSGKWQVSKINGEDYTLKNPEHSKKPFIELDIQKSLITGMAGCNSITGQITSDPKKLQSIQFPGTASTRMMCPNIEIENQVLKAVGEVATYKLSPSTNELFFQDKAGREVLRLVKVQE
ncbi:MAG: META domain-containing protein [Bacteroides sp.]